MHERPADLDDSEVAFALLERWQLAADALRYLPVGFGGHHWLATSPAGSRWFVTVNALPGADGEPVMADLAATMETAARLASAGLDFVVGPARTTAGRPLHRLSSRYAITVYPYCDGVPGSYGDILTSADRLGVIGMLASLHGALAVLEPGSVPVRSPQLGGRDALEQSLRERAVPWRGGPFAEPARALLTEFAPQLVRALARFDALVARLSDDDQSLVVTHGEPHPGNLMRMPAESSEMGFGGSSRGVPPEDFPAEGGFGLRGVVGGCPPDCGVPPIVALVDWDTVGLALPERDLWWVVTEGGREAARYTELTGRAVSEQALALYRLRWALDDICAYVAEFRAPHTRTPDTEVAWAGISQAVRALEPG